jgi:glucosylceramidase
MNHFASSYMFWNLILNEKSTSTWGWKQNSLLKIDSRSKSIIYNPEFYSLKHFGHFLQTGAVRIGVTARPGGETVSTTRNVAAFRNPSGELVVILSNNGGSILPITLQSRNHATRLELPAKSMNSVVLSGW